MFPLFFMTDHEKSKCLTDRNAPPAMQVKQMNCENANIMDISTEQLSYDKNVLVGEKKRVTHCIPTKFGLFLALKLHVSLPYRLEPQISIWLTFLLQFSLSRSVSCYIFFVCLHLGISTVGKNSCTR